MLLAVLGLFLGVALLRAVGIVARRLGAGIMQYRMQAHSRRAVTRQYLSLPMEWHQRHPTGQLLSNANSDVEAAWGPIAPLPMAVGTIAMMVIAVAQMFVADVVLALVGLLVFPAVIAANLVYQRLASPLMTRAQQLRAELSEVAHESFDGAMVVKTLGREPEETARFADKAHQLRDVNIRAGRIRAAFDPTLAALPSLGVLIVLAVGVERVLTGATDAGDVVTVAYLLTIVSFPIRSIGWLLGEFPRSVVGFDRVSSVLEATGEMAYGDARSRARPHGGARLEVDGLGYRYDPDQPLLQRRQLRGRAGPHRRARRRHRLRQEHADQPGLAPGRPRRRPDPPRRHRPARPRPAASWPRPLSRRAADRLPLRRHRPRQRHPRRRRLRRRGLGGPAGRPGRRLRRGAARTGSTPGSASAAPRCPAVSASGSRWPGRWCAGRGCWSSTTRPRPSTPRSRRGSCAALRAGGADTTLGRRRLPQGHDRAGRRGRPPRGRPGRRPRHPRRAARPQPGLRPPGQRLRDGGRRPRGGDTHDQLRLRRGDRRDRDDPPRRALLARAQGGHPRHPRPRGARLHRPGRRADRGAADPRPRAQRSRRSRRRPSPC